MLENKDAVQEDTEFPEIINNSALDEQDVIDVLKSVFDPEIDYSIYDIGLIYKITLNEKDIHILMTLTTVNCPEAQSLPENTKLALENEFPDYEVEVELTFDPEWTVENMDEAIKLKLGLL